MSVTAHAAVDEHAHDHGHHHHKETFVTKYIFSQDHKMISKQYPFTFIIRIHRVPDIPQFSFQYSPPEEKI